MSKQALDRTEQWQRPLIPVMAQGTVQLLTVGASATSAWIEFGAAPDAQDAAVRIRIFHGREEYFKVTGGEKIAADVAGTNEVSAAFGLNTTVVRVVYDNALTTVEVMECA